MFSGGIDVFMKIKYKIYSCCYEYTIVILWNLLIAGETSLFLFLLIMFLECNIFSLG